MFDINTLDDLIYLAESVDFQCKLAQGHDGMGEVPKYFWPTYSAMANTHGGLVLLGVREKGGKFTAAGISDVEKVRSDLFNTLNNSAKVSVNLINDDDVSTRLVDGRKVLQIRIPVASRRHKPVFLNGQPLGNTYRRLNDGDRRCNDETVKRMLAEQVEDERDARILIGYTMNDIDADSLRIYRQMLRDEKPAHPFLEQDDIELFKSLRGWRRDRESGLEGFTLAGLLMFGKWSAIQEAAPHYFLDYQERAEAKTELRWIDRLVPDGTWTGNLFEFYRRVYRKLTIDLKVPFSLRGGQRQDDTLVHMALREALVNTLVHADYTGRVSVLVVKRPDLFGFRNPGGLRLPIEQILRGGDSDCRNRILHQMFLLIGLGERGGSGIPKIYSGWKSQHWRPPALYELVEPEQTRLELRMLDLLPEKVVVKLREMFGERFDTLSHAERLILATAAIEQVVNHGRMASISDLHPHDLSGSLARLERDGFLSTVGHSRAKVYHLPGASLLSPEQVFPEALSSGNSEPSSGHNDSSYGDSGAVRDEKSGAKRDHQGCLLSKLLDAPIVDDLNLLARELRDDLERLATEPRSKARLNPETMELVILKVCKDRYITRNVLAKLLNRNAETLRKSYLDDLVKSHKMRLAFPGTPTHEKQSYRSALDVLNNPSDD